MTDDREPPRSRHHDRPAPVPLVEFSRSMPAVLMHAREAVMAWVRPVLNDFGLTEVQWRVLRALAQADDMEIGHLAREIHLLPNSLSRVLRDLERRGLIARHLSAADLRRNLVSLPAAGRRLFEEAAPAAVIVASDIERCFGADRTRQLHTLLVGLADALNADAAHRRADPDAAQGPEAPARRSRG